MNIITKLVYYIILFVLIAILISYSIAILLNYRKAKINDLFKVGDFDKEYYAIKLKNGKYFKVYEINGVDIKNIAQEDKNAYYGAFYKYLKSNVDISFVFRPMPIEIENTNYKKEYADTPFFNKLLELRLLKAQQEKEKNMNERCYLYIYADNQNALNEAMQSVQMNLLKAVSLIECDRKATIEILKVAFNPQLNFKQESEGLNNVKDDK